ncbi:MAG: DNA gyrase inhibitor [Clostridiales bacterium]|nr:DNA gyrase inhibitor [Clostridiales bacterium]
MNTHVENIPAHSILYMRRTGPYGAENYQLMQTMKDWITKHDLWEEGSSIYGIAQDNPTTQPEKCRYDVCFVTETLILDEVVHQGTLPAGEHLVFEILHTAEEVKRFWGSIGDALAHEDRLPDGSRPVLERYQFSLVEKGYCEFCVPIL